MKKLLFLVPVMAFFICCTPVSHEEACPVLSVEGGQIQGVSAENDGVFVFRGIPYAAPPIGELRWREPQPVVAWDGIRLCDL